MLKEAIVLFLLFFVVTQSLLAKEPVETNSHEVFLKQGYISSQFQDVLLYDHFYQQTFIDRPYYAREVLKVFRIHTRNRTSIKFDDDLMLAETSEVYKKYLLLDPNSDGILTEKELESVATKVFDMVDKNSDRHITHDEIKRFKTELIDHSSHSSNSCSVPTIPQNTNLIAIKILEGTAISSVSTMGQDILTSAVTVRVEKLTKPMVVIVISKDPIIWQFTGNTPAIQQLIVHSDLMDDQGNPSVGVTGLKKSVIRFLKNGCLPDYYNEPLKNNYRELKSSIKKLVGRDLEMVVEESLRFGLVGKDYEVSAFSLASDKVQPVSSKYASIFGKKPVPEGYHPKMWMGLLHRFPDGVAKIDSSTVVADGKIEPYEVLPGGAGLAKLAYGGFITYGWKILKDIPRLPGGNHWKKRATIILSKGVSFPEGDPGDSCVLSEDTGEVLYAGFDCFSDGLIGEIH